MTLPTEFLDETVGDIGFIVGDIGPNLGHVGFRQFGDEGLLQSEASLSLGTEQFSTAGFDPTDRCRVKGGHLAGSGLFDAGGNLFSKRKSSRRIGVLLFEKTVEPVPNLRQFVGGQLHQLCFNCLDSTHTISIRVLRRFSSSAFFPAVAEKCSQAARISLAQAVATAPRLCAAFG
jgi:hypothetical protein